MKYFEPSHKKFGLKLLVKIFAKILLSQILILCLIVSCKNDSAKSEQTASFKETVLPPKTLLELEMEITKDPGNYKLLIDKLAVQNNDVLPHDYQIQLLPIMSIALSNNEEQNCINYISTKFRLKPEEIDWLYLQYELGFAAVVDTSLSDSIPNELIPEIIEKPVKKTESVVIEDNSKYKIKAPTSNKIKNDLIGKKLNSNFTFSQLSDIKSLKIIQTTESNPTLITFRVDMVLGDDKYQAKADVEYRLVENEWKLTKLTDYYFDEFVKPK